MSMRKQFEGEIVIFDSADVPHVVAALAAVGIEFRLLPDLVDECSDAAFGEIRGTTELDENALWIWLQDLIRSYAEIEECGLAEENARQREVGAS